MGRSLFKKLLFGNQAYVMDMDVDSLSPGDYLYMIIMIILTISPLCLIGIIILWLLTG